MASVVLVVFTSTGDMVTAEDIANGVSEPDAQKVFIRAKTALDKVRTELFSGIKREDEDDE